MPENRAIMTETSNEPTVLTELAEAIEALERGAVSAPVSIQLANNVVLEAAEDDEIDGLLQRARGLRLIMMIAAGEPVERPSSMRHDRPAVHARVKDILDALK
ncbi:hypothetical protein [Henriciella marina]|uniref:Uncharacterized protein n=1 Tax=Henriciella marina TaxID=453851 RepID=A0ABT4LV74_9PROT|nr:hypothetical protein [Henriciella marina]MCZ4298269.1 hypothetical protein [Henriciella marina]